MDSKTTSLYSTAVLYVAAKKSLFHISWLVTLITVPIVYFSDGLTIFEKVLLFLFFLLFFWLVYFGLCVGFHRFGLRDKDARIAYLAKDDHAKGEELGSFLEGW